ncbi:MAG: hypothetical protein LBV67_10500 [Streptococcaceae bacterium]|jgi:hypothetical protein|nr:hypothetical protein [Streptococcaceae bacterium]
MRIYNGKKKYETVYGATAAQDDYDRKHTHAGNRPKVEKVAGFLTWVEENFHAKDRSLDVLFEIAKRQITQTMLKL